MFNILILFLVGSVFAGPSVELLAVSAAGGFVGGSLMSFTPLKGTLQAGIIREIWQDHIIANFFKNNEFLTHAYNADEYVLAGKVVHRQHAGASPGVKINRTSLPAAVVKRNDTDSNYSLDEITSDPLYLEHAELIEESPEKMESALSESLTVVKEAAADNILNRWAPDASNVILSTGDVKLTGLAGTTGNRKAITLADIRVMQKAFDKQNVPSADRYALLGAEQYDELLAEMSLTQQRDFSSGANHAEGIIGKLYGFNIMKRSVALAMTAAKSPIAWGAAASGTDTEASLFWQKDCVERAMGEVKFFENIGDPQYYGDIYSYLIRFGGSVRNTKGVFALQNDQA